MNEPLIIEYENMINEKNIKIASLNKIINTHILCENYPKEDTIDYYEIFKEIESENKELKEINKDLEKRLIIGKVYYIDIHEINEQKKEIERLDKDCKNLSKIIQKLILEKNKSINPYPRKCYCIIS